MNNYSELENALNRPYPTMRFVRIDPERGAIFRGLYEIEAQGYPKAEVRFDPEMLEAELVSVADWIAKDAANAIETLVVTAS